MFTQFDMYKSTTQALLKNDIYQEFSF